MRLHNMFKKTGEKITSIHSRNRRKPEAPEGILKKCNKCGAAILTDETLYRKMSQAPNPYGDGRASERIVQSIQQYFGAETSVSEFKGGK